MANWCYTRYIITGDPEELVDLSLKLEYIRNVQISKLPHISKHLLRLIQAV